MLAPRLEGFLRSDRARRWRRALTRLSGYGTAPYPPPVRRRLRIMNVAAYLIALFTLVYTIEQIILDYQTWKPVIFINLALIAIALAAPFLHRFNDSAAALTLGISENVGLFALTWILGTQSGLHMQYFAAVAAYFVVFGLGRLKLIIALILAGLALHLGAWAWFTQERALLNVQPYELAELYVTAVLTTSAMVAAVVYYAFRLAEEAQEETDALLHSILPAPIVDRLKSAPGAVIADELADASVLFADLKGFVALAKRLGPARTVELLNAVVRAFDDLADQWHVEKIKTIGDAYMAASGLPEPAADHAQRLGGMALAMQATLARIAREQGLALTLRIGIASGPVLAGVIGAKRLTYDVWGDTVNLASRLEGQSQPGRVLVSRATKAQIDRRFAVERCGALDLKGFGLEEAWYLVEELRTEGGPPPASGAAVAPA